MRLKVNSLAWRRAKHELDAVRVANGEIPASLRHAFAGRLGITDRHLRRMLQVEASEAPVPPLDDEQLAYLAAYPTPTEAYRALVRKGVLHCSLSTFVRKVSRINKALYDGIVSGEETMRNSYAYLHWEAPAVNHTWQQDTAKAWVNVLYGRTPVNPWIEVIIDDYSRLVVAVRVWPKAPDAEMAASAVALAVSGRFTPDRLQTKPRAIRHDQGAYYTGAHYSTALAEANIMAVAVTGRSPHLKGKVERFNRTMRNECLRHLPGSFAAPKALGEGEQPLHDQRDRLLSFDEFVARVEAWVERYNTARPHGSLGGRTPAEVWASGVTTADVSPQDLVALRRRPSLRRKLSKNGLRWEGHDYTHPLFTGMVGTIVEVGPIDGAEAIEIYLEGEWWCTAQRASYWQDQPEEFMAARAKLQKQARTIRARASQLRSEGVPSIAERDDLAHDQLLAALDDADDTAAGAGAQSA